MKKIITFITPLLLFALISCNSGVKEQGGAESSQIEEEDKVEDTNLSNNQLQGSSMVATVQHINTEEFLQYVCEIEGNSAFQYKGELPALVDFYADLCGPCRSISPFLEEFAKEYAGKIIIYKVDVDNNQELATVLGINSIPRLLFFKPNEKPESSVGAPSKEALEVMIKEHLLQ